MIVSLIEESKSQRVKESKRLREKGTKRLRVKETKRGSDKKKKGQRNQENPLKSMAAAPLL